MTKSNRQQLTLFLRKPDAEEIEAIRKKYNPLQRALIDCHVTLCREDEIENIDKVLENLETLEAAEIIIHFGNAKRFEEGKGVLIPAEGDNAQFHQLRGKVLAGLDIPVRHHESHITLMHPRNSTCTDEIFGEIQKSNLPIRLKFDSISLIDQVDGGMWEVIRSFGLVPI